MAKNFIWAFIVLLSYSSIGCDFSRPGVNIVDPGNTAETVIIHPEPVVDTAIVSDDLLPGDPPIIYIEQTTEQKILQPTSKELRDKTQEIFRSQIGVREKTGNNDGSQVEKYLRSVGLGKGYAYCSAFVRWVFDSAGIKTNITAWSPTAHNSENVVYENRRFFKDPAAADVFTIWYTSKKRIAHTGFIDGFVNSSIITTVEANTNDALSREGDGVYRKKRPINTIYSITRYIKD